MTIEERGILEYLGIKINNLADGSYKLTQPGLILHILEATNMATCNAKMTPTKVVAPLGTDTDSKPAKHKQDCVSVVDMLLLWLHFYILTLQVAMLVASRIQEIRPG